MSLVIDQMLRRIHCMESMAWTKSFQLLIPRTGFSAMNRKMLSARVILVGP